VTYRPEIDGLRAIAVLGVLFFHAGIPFLSGGYVGVDVFFVISGYLITGIILDDCRRGQFSILAFYARRVRRIFPALIAVLVCSLAAGWFLLLPNNYAMLSKEAFAAALFVPNFLFWSEAGYFDTKAILKPLLHLWSLGIEEQFYLVWPFTLLLVARQRILTIGILLIITIFSFALGVYMTPRNAASAFYLPQFRIWELSRGALIACIGPLPANPTIRSVASVLGLAGIGCAMVLFKPDSLFPGYIAALPTLATTAVIWSGRDSLAARYALSSKAIVYLGLISYPLYLWHWPLLSLARYRHIEGPLTSTALLIASFILAVATYEVIEKRFRKLGMERAFRPLIIGMTSAAGVAAIVFFSGGINYRYQKADQADVASILSTMKYEYETDARLYSCWLRNDRGPQDLAPECLSQNAKDDGILVWGDSHAARLYPGLRRAFPDLTILQATRSSCPFFAWGGICNSTNALALDAIETKRPQTVILFTAWVNYSEDWGPPTPYGMALREALVALKPLKVPNLIVLGPGPNWGEIGLPSLAYEAWERTGQIPVRLDGLKHSTTKVESQIKAIAESSGVAFISLTDLLCDVSGCLVHVPGKPGDLFSWDYGHLTTAGAEYLASHILNRAKR
jgi:peptidoglycan/LPS O-acetylase OafA/YrhL